MPTRIVILALASFGLLGSAFMFSNLNANIYDKSSRVLYLPQKEVFLTVVNNSESRVAGLSGTKSLDHDKAMLFVFDSVGQYGIWMKDMNYSIDIFWLDDQKKIISIESDVAPDTYPEVFRPKDPSLYVLETNAGFAKENNLTVGKVLNFDLK